MISDKREREIGTEREREMMMTDNDDDDDDDDDDVVKLNCFPFNILKTVT